MKNNRIFKMKVVALATAMLSLAACGANNIDDSAKENAESVQKLPVNEEISGKTTVLYSGITAVLNRYTDNLDIYSDTTGTMSFYDSGITSMLNKYGEYLSNNVSASIEELDIATKFVPEDSILDGYEVLGVSTVNSYLNIRKGPGVEHKVVGKMPGNCACEILSEENGWYKINSGDVTGYVKKDYIVTGYDANLKAMEKMETVLRVECDVLNVREKADANSEILSSVIKGQTLEIIEETDGWYLIDINNLRGYISAEYVKRINSLPVAEKIVEIVVNQQYQNNDANNNGSNTNSGSNSSSGTVSGTTNNKKPTIQYDNLDMTVSQTALDLINNAMQYLGNRYVPGGSSLQSGTDCSGFTMLLYAQYGYELPRSSTEYVNTKYTLIPMSQAKPGDIVLYNYGSKIGHVAIYIGDGKIIHSSNKKDGVKISTAYYTTPYAALRVIP